MIPLYKETPDSLEISLQNSSHIPPHLHKSLELVYVAEGSLELGIGQELHHMETGDFALIFPDIIHHYQVFDSRNCKAYYLLTSPSLSGTFQPELLTLCPENPIIPHKYVHPDIVYAFQSLYTDPVREQTSIVHHAFIQLILARSFPFFNLVDKNSIGSNDIVYQTVCYIAAHFKEHISLTIMAHDLGFGISTLSRVFSGVFHCNFNQYLNKTRLDYACSLLKNTAQTITEVYENAGFDSQRTFNRVFLEEHHISPREYRKQFKLHHGNL